MKWPKQQPKPVAAPTSSSPNAPETVAKNDYLSQLLGKKDVGFGVAYLVVLVPVCWLIVVVSARVPKGAAIPLETLGL